MTNEEIEKIIKRAWQTKVEDLTEAEKMLFERRRLMMFVEKSIKENYQPDHKFYKFDQIARPRDLARIAEIEKELNITTPFKTEEEL